MHDACFWWRHDAMRHISVGLLCLLRMQSGHVMPAVRAAEFIAAAIMAPKPPREIVTGARARTALLAGFLQKFVCPGFIEARLMRMFGLAGLRRQ